MSKLNAGPWGALNGAPLVIGVGPTDGGGGDADEEDEDGADAGAGGGEEEEGSFASGVPLGDPGASLTSSWLAPQLRQNRASAAISLPQLMQYIHTSPMFVCDRVFVSHWSPKLQQLPSWRSLRVVSSAHPADSTRSAPPTQGVDRCHPWPGWRYGCTTEGRVEIGHLGRVRSTSLTSSRRTAGIDSRTRKVA